MGQASPVNLRPTPMANFEAARYMGLWYSIRHCSGIRFQPDSHVAGQTVYNDLDPATGKFTIWNTV